MSDNPGSNDERPCLHCLIADVIDDFYAEYGTVSGEKDTVDMDEIISALGKTIAEMTFGSDAALRQRILEDLTHEIAKFEAEYASSPGSDMRH
jgi:hypothetical protein